MWNTVDRIVKTFADLTLGTVIVLVHVARADRQAQRAKRTLLKSGIDGTRTWSSQISS